MKKIILDGNNRIEEPCAVTIGKFDGIHKGHLKLLKRLLEEKENGRMTVVFTFDKSIASFFSGESVQNLQLDYEKEEFLSEFGIDYLAIYPVNDKSVKISPADFIKDILVDALNAKVIVAGPDLSYADKGAGDFELLEEMALEYGYTPVMIEKEVYCPDNIEISSTLVRSAVLSGDMKKVKELLGRPYSVSGKVCHGRKLGRAMSFPTVNLIMDSDKLLPPYGVYFSCVCVGTQKYYGVSNVGIKPTISDNEKPCVETHIFDFDDDLYGEYIKVELLEYMRAEMKFASIDDLKNQLASDVKSAKALVNQEKLI